MTPPDEASVKEVPALTKDAEVNKAGEQRLAEEEDVPTLRSSSLDNIVDKNTFRLSLGELDKYSVKKLAEAGFVRTESGVSFFRAKNPCRVDYSLVCDLVANMPESIRAMEARENYERAAAKASEPVRRRSTVPFQSATSLQEWDTLSRIKNSRFAINGKRNYEEYNDGPAGDSTNTVSSAAAAARKPQAQANSTRTNGQQAFLTTSGSKSYEVAKTQSEMGLNMPSPSKRICVTNGSKENPIEIRDDSPSPQQQSESDRIGKSRASLAVLKNDLLDCFRIKHWSEKTVMLCETRLKNAAEMAAKYKKAAKDAAEMATEYTKVAKEKVDEIFRIQELNPEFRDFKPFG
ncbi:hypothetical protein BTUL_0037g00370 [Botrytis tulipae]|uniref:Uncharacterized protein n=1 Tax=Botrytis tulipae TaxID=87230 RepID=A0A4Z1ETU9_9HELO|nr:hypothetical protein BTUL_0037g00370 [Botrytis tulipae]